MQKGKKEKSSMKRTAPTQASRPPHLMYKSGRPNLDHGGFPFSVHHLYDFFHKYLGNKAENVLQFLKESWSVVAMV
jgi:hypothetical protein